MSALTNEFSWSHARHEIFQTCLKRYYFSYYGAWGGWQETAPARTRELYRLKRLSTRQQWAGHHVHQAIEFLFKGARRDSSGAMAATAESRQIEIMRKEFRASRAGENRTDPVHTLGLFEHEYNLEVPPAEWKAIVDRVSLAIRNFLASDLWHNLRELPDEAFLAVERRTHFLLDGLKVFAVPDLVVRQDAKVRIYDWKTGTAEPAGHRFQVGTYALLALDRWTGAPDEIEAVIFNPVLNRRENFIFTAADVESLREFVRDSADEMLFPLEDPRTNQPGDGSNFECIAEEEPCKTCPFLRVCPRWDS